MLNIFLAQWLCSESLVTHPDSSMCARIHRLGVGRNHRKHEVRGTFEGIVLFFGNIHLVIKLIYLSPFFFKDLAISDAPSKLIFQKVLEPLNDFLRKFDVWQSLCRNHVTLARIRSSSILTFSTMVPSSSRRRTIVHPSPGRITTSPTATSSQ